MSKKLLFNALLFTAVLSSCTKEPGENVSEHPSKAENLSSFKEITMIDLGSTGAAEISAFDAKTKTLFVVNNEATTKVDVVDLSKFPELTKKSVLDFSAGSSGVNSLAVNNGMLAVALEGATPQDNGSIAIYATKDLTLIKRVTVGALPDMVTFTPDGKFILSANEGEPNSDYTIDPNGTISIIDTKNFSVRTLDFAKFEAQKAALIANCFRVYGKNASLAKDVEPEYIAVSDDSKTAWVTLQENNAIAEVNISAGNIVKIIPLGHKDISKPGNVFDVSDRDSQIKPANWPLKAFYSPDAISYFSENGRSYLAIANEGDYREYDALEEEVRVKDLKLDPVRFPDAATLQLDKNLGRLTVSKFAGDALNDGDYEELFLAGGRSFSILDAQNGKIINDIGEDLEAKVISAAKYDDGRSDNKGVEPEGITVATINKKKIAFIGMERADAVAIYDITNPQSAKFLQLLSTGDAPEGVLFIDAKDSPNGRSLLIVSSEEDGVVKFYHPDLL